VAEAFARVIDAKSPCTARHSDGVAGIALGMARTMGLGPGERRTLFRAGLLHDIGMLGVSSLILDKPAKLTDGEMAEVRQHTGRTREILSRVRPFREFAAVAAAHHERLDGGGYDLGIGADELGPLARILAVADVCQALSAERPYRPALAVDDVFATMDRMAETGLLCPEACEALRTGYRGLLAVGAGRGWAGETVVGAGVVG
jgi:HD-GYP domain-containing protein (c-di-GMP phosphodiesterase class II)